jgi:ATP-binding cassette subfamily B protein
MVAYGGDKAQKFVKLYQNSLEDLNNASVEYVRGISVVKVFNQTIFPFRKFHQIITDYGQFVKTYTISFEKFMAAFMVIVNHVYVFLIPVLILMAGGEGDYAKFALAAVFYILFSFSLERRLRRSCMYRPSARRFPMALSAWIICWSSNRCPRR